MPRRPWLRSWSRWNRSVESEPELEHRRQRFSAEFKRDAVELVRATGKPIAEIARDLGVGESSLGYWVTRDRRLRGEHPEQVPMTADEREELRRLRRRVAELEMEREILKRATAFWVKESSS